MGSIGAFSSCQNSPWKVTRGSVHSAFIRLTPSVNRDTYRAGSTPKAANGLAASAHTDLDPAQAELVQRAQALGQVHRAVQGGYEHHAPQPYPLGARGRVGHRLDRAELRAEAERRFLSPGALEAELLGPSEVLAEGGGVELAVGVELRDRDRELHGQQRIGDADGTIMG